MFCVKLLLLPCLRIQRPCVARAAHRRYVWCHIRVLVESRSELTVQPVQPRSTKSYRSCIHHDDTSNLPSVLSSLIHLSCADHSALGTGSIIINCTILSIAIKHAAFLVPVFALLTVGLRQCYIKTLRHLSVLETRSSKRLVSHFTDTAAGMAHIRAFQWQDPMIDGFRNILEAAQQPSYFTSCVKNWAKSMLGLICAAFAVLLVTLAVTSSDNDAAYFGPAFLLLVEMHIEAFDWMTTSISVEVDLDTVSRIRSFSENAPQEQFQEPAEPVSADWRATGSLELNSMSTTHG